MSGTLDGVVLYAILKKKINAQGITQEKIDKAIESYLERNPIKRNVYDSETRSVS